jgi:hypothetical protein
LEIDLDNLVAITIQEGGETALLQGGVFGGEVIETLYVQGYVTRKCPVPELKKKKSLIQPL